MKARKKRAHSRHLWTDAVDRNVWIMDEDLEELAQYNEPPRYDPEQKKLYLRRGRVLRLIRRVPGGLNQFRLVREEKGASL